MTINYLQSVRSALKARYLACIKMVAHFQRLNLNADYAKGYAKKYHRAVTFINWYEAQQETTA